MNANSTHPKRPVLQWSMAALGGAVTVAAISVMVWEGLQPSAPPMLRARIVEIEATAAGHVAMVQVTNDGDETAAAVKIEAVLDDQTATATLDYVPGHGEAKAYFRFDANPRTAVVRVQGWSAP
jgi:uncharacterized protein (TIGR02588 family)